MSFINYWSCFSVTVFAPCYHSIYIESGCPTFLERGPEYPGVRATLETLA